MTAEKEPLSPGDEKPPRAILVLDGHALRMMAISVPEEFRVPRENEKERSLHLFEALQFLATQGVQVLIPEAAMIREGFKGVTQYGQDVNFLSQFLPKQDSIYRRGTYLARQIFGNSWHPNIRVVRASAINPKNLAGRLPSDTADQVEREKAYVQEWHMEFPRIMRDFEKLPPHDPKNYTQESADQNHALRGRFQALVIQDVVKSGCAASALQLALDAQRECPEVPVFLMTDYYAALDDIDKINAADKGRPDAPKPLNKLNLNGALEAFQGSGLLERFGLRASEPGDGAKLGERMTEISTGKPKAGHQRPVVIDSCHTFVETKEMRDQLEKRPHPFAELMKEVQKSAPPATTTEDKIEFQGPANLNTGEHR